MSSAPPSISTTTITNINTNTSNNTTTTNDDNITNKNSIDQVNTIIRPIYLLEKRIHIQQLNLYVHCSATDTAISIRPYHLVLQIKEHSSDRQHDEDFNDNESDRENQPAVKLLQIPLDCQISNASVSTSTNPTIHNLRVHKMPTSHLFSSPIATSMLTNDPNDDFPLPAEMMSSNYSDLFCRQCSKSILRRSPKKCNGLPSTYWEELIELWYCHTINNAKLDAISRVSIEARPSQILVGVVTLVLHPSDVKLDEFIIGDKRDDEIQYRKRGSGHNQSLNSTSTDMDEEIEEIPNDKEMIGCQWRNFICRSCNTLCGFILVAPSPNSISIGNEDHAFEICLFKHRISNVLPNRHSFANQSIPRSRDRKSQNSALQKEAPFASYISSTSNAYSLFMAHYTIESWLAAELLASVESRFQYRFILLRTPDHSSAVDSISPRMIQIQILNTDCWIRTETWPTVQTTSTQSTAVTCPVLKLGYSILSSENLESAAVPSHELEPISLTWRDFDYIETVLLAHSRLYPVEFRKYKRFDQSFLCHLNRHGVMTSIRREIIS
jgi:hypothetical protein